MSRGRLLALAWAGVVLVSLGLLGSQVRAGLHFETGLLALLPSQVQRPLVGDAVDRMAESGSRHAVLLVGQADPAQALLAADACAASLRGQPGIAQVVTQIEGSLLEQAKDFYLPHRYSLLTSAQRVRLTQESDTALLSGAAERLYQPVGPPRLAPLESDPFNLLGEALLEVASASALRPLDNHLVIQEGGTTWAAVLVQLSESSASIAQQKALLGELEAGIQAARRAGAQEVLRAGFVFHAAESATQAEWEVSVIGAGSLLGVVLLMLAVFRSFNPLLLVLLPLVVGCAVALAFSLLIFPRLHLITLVFGTSIIGVAVDYGILFVSGRVEGVPWNAAERRRQILPSVGMALGTSILAYACLVLMPFPLLRQMGTFSILGLSAAWLTALLWLPLLGKSLPDLSAGRLPRLLAWAHARWPRVEESWALRAGLAVGVAAAIYGVGRWTSNDDVRALYAPNPQLVQEQARLEKLLRLPEAGQFFLLTGKDEEELLQRSEALTLELERMRSAHQLSAFQSVSSYLPSLQRQEKDRALQWERLYRPGALVSQLFAQVGSPEVAEVASRQAQSKLEPLTPKEWLASPISLPFRSLWLGKTAEGMASLATVSGVAGSSAWGELSQLGQGRAGVEFVDHLRSLGDLMRRLRLQITGLMLAGYAVVTGLLFLRYRRRFWRAVLPALLSCLGTAGLFGLWGWECNLLCVFGLLLALDMGVDYGIYMQENGAGAFGVRLLSASVAALCTLLSFGMLALSHTPALRSFGLCVLLAISGSWLLAPCFSTRNHELKP